MKFVDSGRDEVIWRESQTLQHCNIDLSSLPKHIWKTISSRVNPLDPDSSAESRWHWWWKPNSARGPTLSDTERSARENQDSGQMMRTSDKIVTRGGDPVVA